MVSRRVARSHGEHPVESGPGGILRRPDALIFPAKSRVSSVNEFLSKPLEFSENFPLIRRE